MATYEFTKEEEKEFERFRNRNKSISFVMARDLFIKRVCPQKRLGGN